jgi:DNA polymerase III gamma/tau subunit
MLPDLTEQAGLFSREDLLRLFDVLLKVEADLKHATQTRFQLEMGLIELAQIPRMRSLEELIADFARLVEGGAHPGISAPRAVAPASAVSHPAGARSGTTPPAKESNRTAAPPARNAVATDRAPAVPPTPVAASMPAPEGTSGAPTLLEQIAAAVQRGALESILHSLAGARLQGNSVILDLGQSPNEFLRRQLKDNLADIAQAASAVVGRTVQVLLDEVQTDAPRSQSGLAAAREPSEEDVLERAKKDPVVQSFLKTFPGPVKAEKLKP